MYVDVHEQNDMQRLCHAVWNNYYMTKAMPYCGDAVSRRVQLPNCYLFPAEEQNLDGDVWKCALTGVGGRIGRLIKC